MINASFEEPVLSLKEENNAILVFLFSNLNIIFDDFVIINTITRL